MMKSTGIVRKVDELGRIVLPVECRRVMEIEDKDALEVFVEDHYPQKIRAGLHFLRGVPGRGHVQGAQRLPRLREKPGQTVCRRLKNP